MDSSSRLIWFFDHFNPYFQCGYAVLGIACTALCFWSISRRFSPGILLLGTGCFVGLVQTACWILSAFQESHPFLPFLPLEIRKEAYLFGRLLGPPQALLFPITILVIVFENARRKTT